MLRPALATLATVSLGASLAAQSFNVVVRDGDVVPGVGNVTSIDNLTINDTGSWIVRVDTDNPMSNRDGALIRDGVLYLKEGDALAAPAGATIRTFDTVNQNTAGNSAWNFFLDGTSGSSDDSGVFFNTTLVIQEGDVSTAAALTPGTPYIGFFELKIDSSGDALLMASVDDPNISSGVDRVLNFLDLDGSGALLSDTVLFKEGDAPAALGGDSITDMETGPHNFDLNDGGDVVFVADVTSTFGGNAALFKNATVIAREDAPSPVAGRTWQILTSKSLDVNGGGSVLFRANLDGDTADDDVLVLDGTTVVAREGDSFTAPTGTFAIDSLGSSSPVALSDSGDELYYLSWDDTDTTRDSGIVLNGSVLVQEGLTLIGGDLVESVGSGVSNLFAMSANGRWIVFECKLTGGVDAAVLIDLEGPGSFCDAGDASLAACPCSNPGLPGTGCDNAQATGGVLAEATAFDTNALTATITGTGFPPMATPTAIVIRGNNREAAATVFFDGVRCVGTVGFARLAATAASGGTSTHSFGHGVGTGTYYYQLWYRNTPATFCDSTAAANTSSGVALTWP